jgi:hypothetical protein
MTMQSGKTYSGWGACWLNHADARPTTGAELVAIIDHLIAVGHAPATADQYICAVYDGQEWNEYQSRLTFYSTDCPPCAAETVARVLNEYYALHGIRQRVAVDHIDRRMVVQGAPHRDTGAEIGESEPHDWM